MKLSKILIIAMLCTMQHTQHMKADYSGQDLPGDLTGTDFSNQDLTNANLAGHNLTNANFTNANLTGINLNGTLLAGANFTNANLTNTQLFAANLNGANVTNANFTGANVEHANFSNVIGTVNLTSEQLATIDQSKPAPIENIVSISPGSSYSNDKTQSSLENPIDDTAIVYHGSFTSPGPVNSGSPINPINNTAIVTHGAYSDMSSAQSPLDMNNQEIAVNSNAWFANNIGNQTNNGSFTSPGPVNSGSPISNAIVVHTDELLSNSLSLSASLNLITNAWNTATKSSETATAYVSKLSPIDATSHTGQAIIQVQSSIAAINNILNQAPADLLAKLTTDEIILSSLMSSLKEDNSSADTANRLQAAFTQAQIDYSTYQNKNFPSIDTINTVISQLNTNVSELTTSMLQNSAPAPVILTTTDTTAAANKDTTATSTDAKITTSNDTKTTTSTDIATSQVVTAPNSMQADSTIARANNSGHKKGASCKKNNFCKSGKCKNGFCL